MSPQLNKECFETVIDALIKNMKKQIKQGRPGPSNIEKEDVKQLVKKGLLKYVLTEDNPPYIELKVIPQCESYKDELAK